MFHRSPFSTSPLSVTDSTSAAAPARVDRETDRPAGRDAAGDGGHGEGCCGRHEHCEHEAEAPARDPRERAAA